MATSKPELKFYKDAIRQAWADGIITSDEENMLKALRESMGITQQEHDQIIKVVMQEITKDGIDAYRLALEQAWMDNILTADEKITLGKLREVLGISEDEHNRLETEIRIKKIHLMHPKTAIEHITTPSKIAELQTPQSQPQEPPKIPAQEPAKEP